MEKENTTKREIMNKMQDYKSYSDNAGYIVIVGFIMTFIFVIMSILKTGGQMIENYGWILAGIFAVVGIISGGVTWYFGKKEDEERVKLQEKKENK